MTSRILLIVLAIGPPMLATSAQDRRSSLDREAPVLTLPMPAEVDRIVASRSAIPGLPGRETIREIVISDARQIKLLLEFMEARNKGWWTPWDTFPSSDWTIVLEKNGKPLLILWTGGGWLGGRDE